MNIDDQIREQAKVYSERLNAVAKKAVKEEEIRVASERELAFIQQATGIKLEGKHEFTVASGRIDSVYDRVIIEYKNPSSASGRIGPRADSPGTLKVVNQIKSRFHDLHVEHGQDFNSLFGVGLDGRYFVFVRFRDGKWSVFDPTPVTPQSTERFLWALFNLGTSGKPFSPDELARDFGSEASMARSGVKSLYEILLASNHPKVVVFFDQWKILFGEVCGYDVDMPSEALRDLATSYALSSETVQPAQLLFALHTYYALFMKLLASELVASFHPTPTPLRKILQAKSNASLKRELEDLESGSIFRHLNITNFLEGDLFSWYISAWSEPIEQLIRSVASTLDEYNPGTLLEEPAESRDLLKQLYQKLFPRTVRHALGEYYTPDWLAEHLLDQLGYDGDPDKRILDPACGSGTFLVMAIGRIRRWYEANRELRSYDEGELCRKILANVIGFDLNPLAVMAARTNVLISLRDLIRRVDRIELPVYLCDSIMTPSTHGGLFVGHLEKAKELKTAAGTFLIPVEIAKNKEDVALYAELLESCIKGSYSPAEFIQRCLDDGLPVSENELHNALYQTLVKLDKENRNGVWARIIKNSFAPLFIHKVDYIVGNPPWINWRNLPAGYRAEMGSLWARYGLLTQKGLKARLGAGMDDISVLMTYVSADMYLKLSGRLGFVITQSLFQSAGGGQGFRRFQISDNVFLKVEEVHDFTSFQPFDGATNRTASAVFQKSKRATEYPVAYSRFALPPRKKRLTETTFASLVVDDLEAMPISSDHTSAWSVTAKGIATGMPKLSGASPYQARIGVHSGGASGVFWVNQLQKNRGSVLIQNCADIGRNPYPEVVASIEGTLLRPLVRGRDMRRWRASPSLSIVLPYDEDNDGKAISESRLKKDFPKTYSYFAQFKSALLARAHYRAHFAANQQPYWSMYNVGNYTFAPHQVVWREQSRCFGCVVLDMGEGLSPVVDHKLSTTACSTAEEAHYLAAVLNSSPATFFIQSYVISIQISTHVLSYLNIPRFSEEQALHRDLAALSLLCHAAASRNDAGAVAEHMNAIDYLAAELWSLSESELAGMQAYVAPLLQTVDDMTEE